MDRNQRVMISSPSDIVMNLDDPVEGEVVISGEANEKWYSYG